MKYESFVCVLVVRTLEIRSFCWVQRWRRKIEEKRESDLTPVTHSQLIAFINVIEISKVASREASTLLILILPNRSLCTRIVSRYMLYEYFTLDSTFH
jgi:hypothetical protein